MIKHSKWLFWFSEINLLLWGLVLVFILKSNSNSSDDIYIQYVCFIGAGLATIMQHWAYYKIHKPLKQKPNEK